MTILAIDPGTEKSGWCFLSDDGKVISGEMQNRQMLRHILACHELDHLAIEMVASYGMPVGAEVFDTCVWIGRFQERWRVPDATLLIYRKDVKLHLCGSTKAKDANIRQALIDKFGPGKLKAVGKKSTPGPLYGVKSHGWSALAVAVTAQHRLKCDIREAT